MKNGKSSTKQDQKNCIHSTPKHQTNFPSPISNKYNIKFDVYQNSVNKLFLNPYNKKFNVRRLNKTQQSRSNSKDRNKDYDKLIPQKIQTKIKTSKHLDSKSLGLKTYEILEQKLRKMTHTLDVKRKKTNMPIIKRQFSSLVKKNQESPYLKKHKFRTLENQSKRNDKDTIEDETRNQKLSKYSYLTKFELEEIQKYDVYFSGKRRISSIMHFTDNEGNAKISIGDSIGYRYQIKSSLGQGSFGQVFKSFDHKKKQYVALKIIKNHPKFNRQSKVQIKILQLVLLHDHTSQYNIVKLKHGFIFRGHTCLVFQLLHINLYEFLKMNSFKGLSIDLIRRIAIQILQSLMFFQKFNIIHCDLKPENILLKQQNKTGIKVIDVGSGTFEQQQLYTYIQSRFYRAPEIILGIRYTAKIDIWSFGCILCQLYTGYPIFPGQNQTQQILMLIQTFGLPPPELIDKGSRSNKFFNHHQPIIVPNNKGKTRAPASKPLNKRFKHCKDQNFISFLQKCFKWLPEQRFSPHEALLDQWILNGLPPQIKQKHIDFVKSQKLHLSTK